MKRAGQWVVIAAILASLVPMPINAQSDKKSNIDASPVLQNENGNLTAENNTEELIVETGPAPKSHSPFPEAERQITKPAQAAEPVRIAPAPLATDGPLLITAFQNSQTRLTALEIRNIDNAPVDASDWTIRVTYADSQQEVACESSPTGYLFSKQQTTFVANNTAANGDKNTPEPYALDFTCGVEGLNVASVELVRGGTIVERIQLEQPDGSTISGAWARKNTTASYRSGSLMSDFKQDPQYIFSVSAMYYPPKETPLKITEVHMNPNICQSGDTNPLCFNYVKIFNPTDEVINLSIYRLRAGAPSTAATTANTSPLAGSIAPGSVRVVQRASDDSTLYLPAKEGTVWLQDKYGLVSYPSNVTPYKNADLVQNNALAWAFDASNSLWKWSYPSPETAQNVIRFPEPEAEKPKTSSLTPCRDDQYRSEETNRCRNKISAQSSLTSCRADQYRSPLTNRCRSTIASSSTQKPCTALQYRSPDTNRCRNIATAASTLKACTSTQYRSPETNRCRNVATASSSLKPCTENQYRSPETNRCRKTLSTSIPDAAFAVKPVADTTKAFAGWWALGGVGLMGAGYGAWEWRSEMKNGLKKVLSYFHSSK